MSRIEPSFFSFEKFVKLSDIIIGKGKVKTILEFGSRYGEDTVEFAKRFPQATVYTFECNPNSLEECKNNISEYPNIILTEKAVSDENGTVTFFAIDKENTITTWEDGNQGASSLLKASGKYEVEQYAQKEVTVEATTLHSFIQHNRLDNIDLLWMDIQGAELKALKGLKEKISIVKLLHVEVEFMEIYSGQPLFEDIKDFFTQNGFLFLGFTCKSEYSADAVFVNSSVYKKKYLNKINQVLDDQKPLLLKNRLKKVINPKLLGSRTIIFFLTCIKKCRSKNETFPLYTPSLKKRELYLWYLKVLKPLLNIDVQYRKKINSLVPIDIIIPTVKKDLDQLEQVIIAAKENIKHPIKNIFIVSEKESALDYILEKYSCTFIDEETILPIKKTDISYNIDGTDRSGWLYQQLLKLSGDKITQQDYFLVLDSDTVFTRPKVFLHGGKTIFDHSEECHTPYYIVYYNIMKRQKQSSLSFITHYMLFNKKYLQEMKAYIEEQNKTSWLDAIIQNVDYDSLSGFSEYETYGNYMYAFHKSKMKREYWFNLSCSEKPENIEKYIKSYSIHSYNKAQQGENS